MKIVKFVIVAVANLIVSLEMLFIKKKRINENNINKKICLNM